MKTVACKVCDELTVFTDEHLCLNCLEVQGRLEVYLGSEVGREYVRDALTAAYYKYRVPKEHFDQDSNEAVKWVCEELSAQKDLRVLDGQKIKRLEARLAECTANKE